MFAGADTATCGRIGAAHREAPRYRWAVDRFWLLTWTTYGSWLPGDRRGSTSRVRTAGGSERHNVVGEPAAPPQPAREAFARRQMKDTPVLLSLAQARALKTDFERTATFRGWTILAGAVMRNHVHLVVGVIGDPQPSNIIRDFKRRGSRALNELNEHDRRRWWTRGGSTRRLQREANVLAAVRYVREQWRPLSTWVHPLVD